MRCGQTTGVREPMTDDLYVRDGAQALDDVLQTVIGDHQAVAAGEEDVADLGMRGDVVDALVDLRHRHLAVVLAGKAAARAVTAVHGALVGDKQQHAVGIAVRQTGGRGVGVLVQRVGVQSVGVLQLLGAVGSAMLADGIERIVQVDQGQIVGGDGHAQLAERLGNTGLLIGGQVHVLLQILHRLSAVGDLPMPVVPQILRGRQRTDRYESS